ncbi:MAG: precorrin-2 C(20)-methyltransferase [Coriobacteriales bacterium]|nr:precorrin-2 C(20)-methyltransferase [Coriobacteriales bacterium]
MAGTAYGVGVGPGDPELVTLKATRVVGACDVVAFPGRDRKTSVAFEIAAAAMPWLGEKELMALPAPMTDDRAVVAEAQRTNARHVEHELDAGKDVAVLVLGDPGIYSTFSHMQLTLQDDGYHVELVSGVPSFCAAAARLRVPLAMWDEPLHVIPLAHGNPIPTLAGTQVLMKSGSRMAELREAARRTGRELRAVERCGMDGERVFLCTDHVPDQLDYLSVALLSPARHL